MRPGEIDTPALLVDLDAMERNLHRMAGFAARAGMRLRPHAKTHKCIAIARRQVALGAVGVCCQKVSEAEIMVRGGIDDVLVANEVTGRVKLDRLAALARRARIGLCIDHIDGVAEAAAAAERAGATLDVLVEIEVGGRRCGVSPGRPAARIAASVAAQPRLRLRGLQAYHGAAQHHVDHDARRQAVCGIVEAVRETLTAFAGEGLVCEVVSGAGTGTYELEAAGGVTSELQAGSYVFMDAAYARNRDGNGKPIDTFAPALFVLATVMSRPAPERAVVDAGHKAAAVDSDLPEPFALPGVTYQRPSDEHGVLVAENGRLPARGDKVLLVPGHCDPTVNLHDWLVGIRGMHGPGAHVEAVWPVDARGAVF
jgi:D-serine deaminase-like pyridoxal phosphate-dependent protein